MEPYGPKRWERAGQRYRAESYRAITPSAQLRRSGVSAELPSWPRREQWRLLRRPVCLTPALCGWRDTYRRLGVLGQSQVRLQHGQVAGGISLHRRVAACALFVPECGDGCLVAADGGPGEGDVPVPALLGLDLS